MRIADLLGRLVGRMLGPRHPHLAHRNLVPALHLEAADVVLVPVGGDDEVNARGSPLIGRRGDHRIRRLLVGRVAAGVVPAVEQRAEQAVGGRYLEQVYGGLVIKPAGIRTELLAQRSGAAGTHTDEFNGIVFDVI